MDHLFGTMCARSVLKSLTRVGFVWLGAVGLVANLAMDFIINRRITDSSAARAERVDTLRLIRHLHRAELAIAARDRAAATPELAALGPRPELGAFTSAMAAGRWAAAARSARDLRVATEDVLERNFVRDGARWRNPLAVRTLTLDVALIGIMIVLALMEYRSRERTERCLLASVHQLRAVSRGMEEKLRQIRVKNRTLVHNLKNPVGSIMGFAELIREQALRPASVESHSAVIERLSKTALARVEAMLVEDGPELQILQPLDLSRVVDEVREQLTGLALAKRQVIVSELADLAGLVRGAEPRLAELVSNLLGNAIKYSPRGGTIWLRAFATEREVIVEVEDQGPGFAPEDRAKAFGFGQTLSAKPTGAESSTGYGLYVAREIVAQHGGRIDIADARSAAGARVRVTLPRASTTHALSV